ncbi:hypothetical protein [Clostridium butyricum]|uniref:Flagellar protein FliT n=1 Tax=Clostridium butyricum TaxID=1492 RepID=A0A6L9EIZ2_CLOBU|nr:hypothetical protein [Clostridium butyricum]ALP89498.1 hypothetical protein ATN24_04935 [Clostridium butyricum]ALS15963.1 hypothetical protein ATD26_03510 [Clostridium butyricum]ANF13111.1 hypothetical protein AZ909_03370 [Clostridium butyricum]AOR93182.1 hypothetical protein BBB49_03540 [Clostridium butyricum]MCI3007297.1 hypothetical protein [Clostridium butyricum]
MELKEYLYEYKGLTLDIMERANEDGNIEYLLIEREQILNKIKASNFEQSEFEMFCNELKLVELEKEVNLVIKKEIISSKNKMEKLKKVHSASMKYSAIGYVPSRFNKQM